MSTLESALKMKLLSVDTETLLVLEKLDVHHELDSSLLMVFRHKAVFIEDFKSIHVFV